VSRILKPVGRQIRRGAKCPAGRRRLSKEQPAHYSTEPDSDEDRDDDREHARPEPMDADHRVPASSRPVSRRDGECQSKRSRCVSERPRDPGIFRPASNGDCLFSATSTGFTTRVYHSKYRDFRPRRKSMVSRGLKWSIWRDSNPRPLRPERDLVKSVTYRQPPTNTAKWRFYSVGASFTDCLGPPRKVSIRLNFFGGRNSGRNSRRNF
jgi:hypothetical protein